MDIPLRRQEYHELRAQLTWVVNYLLLRDEPDMVAFVDDALTFLRGHCAECSEDLSNPYVARCPSCGAAQPWGEN